jgi:hypothetical protein
MQLDRLSDQLPDLGTGPADDADAGELGAVGTPGIVRVFQDARWVQPAAWPVRTGSPCGVCRSGHPQEFHTAAVARVEFHFGAGETGALIDGDRPLVEGRDQQRKSTRVLTFSCPDADALNELGAQPSADTFRTQPEADLGIAIVMRLELSKADEADVREPR